MPPLHQAAWKQILAVGCGLPCDPPTGHAMGKDDTTSGRAALRDFEPVYVGSGARIGLCCDPTPWGAPKAAGRGRFAASGGVRVRFRNSSNGPACAAFNLLG